MLPGAHALLSEHHNTGDNTEPHLRDGEPKPVDLTVEHGVDYFNCAMQQPRPQQRCRLNLSRIGQRGNIGSAAP